MLTLLLIIPIVGIIAVLLAGRVHATGARIAALLAAFVQMQAAYLIAASARVNDLSYNVPWIQSFGVRFALQADWVSSLLVLLTAAMTVVAIGFSWKDIRTSVTSFHVWLLLLQAAVTTVFLADDMMLFYLGWELMLIPMLFIIGSWGSGRKEYAAFKFVLFTFAGSVFMLGSIFYLYYLHHQQTGVFSFGFDDLKNTALTTRQSLWIFLGFLIGFGVKAPIFPLHTWLLDAYPNAPVAGSLMLSAVLSKTGVYGLFRFAEPFAGPNWSGLQGVLVVIALFSIFYGAWAAFRQSDIKRLIAYSSFSHVAFILLGLFVGGHEGYTGAVFQMLAHGLTTAALFMVAGIVEQRLQTREFNSIGGLWRRAPVLGGFLLFFSFASLGLPGGGNFVGEIYLIAAAFKYQWWAGGLASLAVLFGAVYALRYFTSVMHGPDATPDKAFPDSTSGENLLLGSLAVVVIITGFFPRIITEPIVVPSGRQVPVSSIQAASTAKPPATLYHTTAAAAVPSVNLAETQL